MTQLRTVIIKDFLPMNALCGGDIRVLCEQASGAFVSTLEKKMQGTLLPELVMAYATKEPITLKVEDRDMGGGVFEVTILDVVYL